MTSRLITTLEPMILEAMALTRAAGLAIAITRGDDIVYARGFGALDVNAPTPVGTDTVFAIASITKLFTAAAILQLAERGRIDLDTTVATYLPYFRLADTRSSEITIAQLLSHTAGLPDCDPFRWHHNAQYDAGALERYVRSLESMAMVSAPGERFRYSSIGFDVLGDVIAKRAGMPYEDYVARYILEPLEMNDATFFPGATPISKLAVPHILDATGNVVASEVYAYNRAHGPDGCLRASVRDMIHWGMANLARGTWNGRTLLKASSYDVLWRPVAVAARGDASHIGLGWRLSSRRGHRLVGHGGLDIGFRAGMTLAPDDGIAVTVLSNSMWTPVLETIHAALDILFGLEPEPLLPPVSTWRTFEGVFHHPVHGEARVLWRDHALWLQYRDTLARLTPIDRNSFVGPWGDPYDEQYFVLRACASTLVLELGILADVIRFKHVPGAPP